MAGETVSSSEAGQNSENVRWCAAAGRVCIEGCAGAQVETSKHGGQGTEAEAGGQTLVCPKGQKADLHTWMY